jgi:hypothetical protein
MPSTHQSPNPCFSALLKLDQFMAASGYDHQHPWRTEIVNAVDACSPVDDAACDIMSDAETIEQLLDLALLALGDAQNKPKFEAAVRAARRYASDIGKQAQSLYGSGA